MTGGPRDSLPAETGGMLMSALLRSKAFYAGIVCALVVGAIAMGVSRAVDLSARDAYKTASVRL